MLRGLGALMVVLGLACGGGPGPDEVPTASPPVEEPAAGSSSAPTEHHCLPDETFLFGGALTPRRDRFVSFCGSPDLDAERGFLVYRYGPPGEVELEYPKERTHPRNHFTYKMALSPPSGFEETLSFERSGGYRYTASHSGYLGEELLSLTVTLPDGDEVVWRGHPPFPERGVRLTQVFGVEAELQEPGGPAR